MRALKIVLGFIGGVILTYVAVVAVAFGYMSANHVFDRDGGMSMAVMFAIGPLAGLIGGAAAAISMAILTRGGATAPANVSPARRRPPKQRAIVAAIGWGAGCFILGWIAIRLFMPVSYDTYEKALAVSLTPYALGGGAAALAVFLVLRNARRESSGTS